MPTQKTNKIHLTQKPVEPLKKFITNSTIEYNVVLDLFSGSGSTAIACIETNRNFIGIDLDINSIELTKRRVEEKRKEKNLQSGTLFGGET